MSHKATAAAKSEQADHSGPAFILPRLSVMMFLEFATLGLWIVTVGTYIGHNTGEAGAGTFSAGFIGLTASTGAIGALVSPILLGMVADRYFSTERLLAVLHVIGAACLWVMCETTSQAAFYVALLVYYQAYLPTTTLTNSLALRHLPEPEQQFPIVRSLGTVGWIAAGVFIGLGWPLITGESIEHTLWPLRIAAICELSLAAYCLTLPRTPALGQASAGWRALTGGVTIWTNRSFLIFLAISVLVAAPTQFYNAFANPFLNHIGFQHAAAKLTLGQLVEVFCMLALPLLMVRFGLKRLFLVGALAWAGRFALLAYCGEGTMWFAYPAILVHGACYTFVYMTGQLYADRLADRGARSAAQGLHTLATGGLGHLAGALTAQWAQASYLTPTGVTPAPYDWKTFWLIAAVGSLIPAILFALFFIDQPEQKRAATESK